MINCNKVRSFSLGTLLLLLLGCDAVEQAPDAADAETIPRDNTGNVAAAGFYSKGPVTDANCLLLDSKAKIASGPVKSDNGVIQFAMHELSGDYFISCSGGSYSDEKSGETVLLSDTMVMRSLAIHVSNLSYPVMVTPLTEVAFQRAEAAGETDSAAMQLQADLLADELGLDGINIGFEKPTSPNKIKGSSSPADIYAITLSALSHWMPSPDEASLKRVMSDLATDPDLGGYRQALSDTETSLKIDLSSFDN
ncbi:MAG: hypothetical protein HQL49_07500, partial [Gammaproteobacteria bacterium]|nr:hypothetical protein [Gammaproteobacteria bacterium]